MQDHIEGFRLSPQQERLWLLQQDSASYHCQCAIWIQGELDVESLRNALRKTVDRHQILRTTFHRAPGIRIPIQRISETGDFSWRMDNIDGRTEQEQEERIEAALRQDGESCFDFERGPVLRSRLLAFSPSRHALIITLPSLCADPWTLRNLVREISLLYDSRVEGARQDEPVQYIQFSEWQNELAEESDGVGDAYWRKLDSPHKFLRLPFEKIRSADKPPEFDCIALEIDPTNLRLAAVARQQESSIPALLLACWQALLYRLTGNADVVVGCAVSGRKHDELHDGFGLFAKYVPVGLRLGSNVHVDSVSVQADVAMGEAFNRQDHFTWEQNEGQTGADYFSAGFEFEERVSRFSAAGLRLSIYKQHSYIDRIKIRLSCIIEEGRLAAEFHYDRAAFDSRDVKRLAGCFSALLEDAIANPRARIEDLNIVSDSDRRQLLDVLGQSVARPTEHQNLHQWFEEQVERTPHRIAVTFQDQHVTYAALNTRANQLGHLLRAQNTAPDAIVGLCVERSHLMIIGLLGILKSGAAYVPLDPEQPKSRLAYQLADTGANVLIAQERLLDRLPHFGGKIIYLDSDHTLIEQQPDSNPAAVTLPQNLCYVVYTSGSTGKPKGVAISHESLVSYTAFVVEKLRLGDLPEGLHFGTVSTIGADLGNTAIFPSLVSGGCLQIFSYEVVMDSRKFAAHALSHPIDVLKIVPSHLRALLGSADDLSFLPRQFLLLGGEALSFDLVERLRQLAPRCRIINHYGPTETTVGSLTFSVQLDQEMSGLPSTVPIGRPVANAETYILDRQFNLVPAGVPGELFIGGKGLARCYLNYPEQTSERFICHPFAKGCAGRLYRTGDLARYLPDGNVEFMGREDDQVKIRGFRVEIGEIESALKQHAAVREAAVAVQQTDPGHDRLIAYIVPNQTLGPTNSELRDFLGRELPDYMLPSAFVTLKSMPLTRNGKIDRKSLPAPDEARPEMTREYVAPRNQAEETLARIWAQVLKLEQVGIHDDFFELGGDSILSLRIISKANAEGLRLTPMELFQHRTIGELATAANHTDPSFLGRGAESVVPLTPVQRLFFEQDLSEPRHCSRTIILETRHKLDAALLEEALRHLPSSHDALRLRFARDDSGWRQFYGGVEDRVPFACVDLSEMPEERQESAFIEATEKMRAALDLTRGPVLSVSLFGFGPHTADRLAIVAHYLAADGASLRILVEDLQAVYLQLSRRDGVNLPSKTTSFKQWAEALSQRAQTDTLREESSYWCDESHLPSSVIPVDFRGGPNSEASAQTVLLALSVDQTVSLLQDAPRAYNTQITDLLLTALAQALAKWTRARSVLLELIIENREPALAHLDVSRTVGCLAVRYPVMLALPANDGGGEALKAVKEQLRRVPQKGIGYGLLRYLSENAGSAERMRGLMQPEVAFHYRGDLDLLLSGNSFFKAAREPNGPPLGRGMRPHLLEVGGLIRERQLHLDFTYSENVHQRATIEGLARDVASYLQNLIVHCQSVEEGTYTPSDFPLAKLNEQQLGSILEKFSIVNKRTLR